MWRTIFTGFVVTACLLAGCNKDSDTSTAPPPAPSLPDTVKPRPSQAELQQRQKLDLKYDPISMMVPPTWELRSLNDGAVVVLEGDTPSDTVGISIPVAHPLTAIREKALEATAKKDQAMYPDLLKGDSARDIPGARVIEELMLDGPIATTQSTTEPAADATQTMQWIVTVCVPSPTGYTAYELRFTGLTLKVYKTDQDFLRSIINSISYTPPSADALPK